MAPYCGPLVSRWLECQWRHPSRRFSTALHQTGGDCFDGQSLRPWCPHGQIRCGVCIPQHSSSPQWPLSSWNQMARSVLCGFNPPIWAKVGPVYFQLGGGSRGVDFDKQSWLLGPFALPGWFHYSWPPCFPSMCPQLGHILGSLQTAGSLVTSSEVRWPSLLLGGVRNRAGFRSSDRVAPIW